MRMKDLMEKAELRMSRVYHSGPEAKAYPGIMEGLYAGF